MSDVIEKLARAIHEGLMVADPDGHVGGFYFGDLEPLEGHTEPYRETVIIDGSFDLGAVSEAVLKALNLTPESALSLMEGESVVVPVSKIDKALEIEFAGSCCGCSSDLGFDELHGAVEAMKTNSS